MITVIYTSLYRTYAELIKLRNPINYVDMAIGSNLSFNLIAIIIFSVGAETIFKNEDHALALFLGAMVFGQLISYFCFGRIMKNQKEKWVMDREGYFRNGLYNHLISLAFFLEGTVLIVLSIVFTVPDSN